MRSMMMIGLAATLIAGAAVAHDSDAQRDLAKALAGHVPGKTVVDLLLTASGETLLEGPRIETPHTHGTGCTLASACATGLAQGMRLEDAVARAWAYVAEAIRRDPGFGQGFGPLDHGWPLRP